MLLLHTMTIHKVETTYVRIYMYMHMYMFNILHTSTIGMLHQLAQPPLVLLTLSCFHLHGGNCIYLLAV